jgi:3-phenylpropionate/cinnamic acid dioxygenase small subunit
VAEAHGGSLTIVDSGLAIPGNDADKAQKRGIGMNVDRQEVENFLYKEARLLDDGKLQEWLALFTPDARYWIPCNRDDIDPMREVSIIFDDRQRMEERVWRIESGLAYAQEPRSRTRHLLTNVEVLPGETEDSAATSSNFVVYELRRGKQLAFVGRIEHRLQRDGEGNWKIAYKKVELLNNNEPIDNLTFIV